MATASISPTAQAQLGAKPLIFSGHLADLPAGVADRHDLMSKQLGHTEIVAAIRRAIASPKDEAYY